MSKIPNSDKTNEYPHEHFGGSSTQPAISFGAVFGAIGGGILMFNAFSISTSSSIHQIYQVLNAGLGAQLITLASIAQHGKTVRKD